MIDRPQGCPDHNCEEFGDCNECLEETDDFRERMVNVDWSATAQSLKRNLLAMDSSPEMKEHIALIFQMSEAYDDYRLGLKHEPRPSSAQSDTEDTETP